MDMDISLSWLDWVIVIAYLAGMIYIDSFPKENHNFEDYFLASKGITMPLLIGTLVSTFSLDTLLAPLRSASLKG